MKPGASIMVMGGTRTFHRMAVMIEDAGFIIKDTLCWLYGSGFPKAQDLGKMIDKREGREREVIGKSNRHGGGVVGNASSYEISPEIPMLTAPSSDLAKYWNGWKIGGIKPAWEPFIWAVKPPDGAWIDNVLKWGVGAVNVDECRVGVEEQDKEMYRSKYFDKAGKPYKTKASATFSQVQAGEFMPNMSGRFPANVIHDGSDEVVGLFPDTKSGALRSYKENHKNASSYKLSREKTFTQDANSGSAARFFYCAKASRSERNAGCENLPEAHKKIYSGGIVSSDHPGIADGGGERQSKNNHPTVKPIALMEYIIKLVTRQGQTVLDPFCGSGTTLCAASKCNRHSIGIDISPDYCKIAENRSRQGVLTDLTNQFD